jgi:excisionase family DNA binding protein
VSAFRLPPSGAAESSLGRGYSTTDAPDKLLDAGEVAELLRVSRRWVEDAARRGDIPKVQLGRFIRFRLEAVLAWLEAQERGG